MKIKHPFVRAGQKIIGVALCLVMVFTTFFIFDPSVLKITASAAVWGGSTSATSGTDYTVSGTTLHIKTPNGLAWFINSLGTYYKYTVYLDDDFDLNSNDDFPVNSTTFTGTFDGQGHTISNFKSECSYKDDNWGFFRYAGGATIRNVNFSNAYVGNYDGDYHSKDNDGYSYGIVVGRVTSATTVSYVTVTGSTVSGRADVGGIIGTVNGSATLENCSVSATNIKSVRQGSGLSGKLAEYQGGLVGYSDGNVTMDKCTYAAGGTVNGFRYSGGLIGFCGGTLKIINSKNYGTVSPSGDDRSDTGGFVGKVTGSVYFDNNENYGTVSNDGVTTGGFIGWISNGTNETSISNCYNYGSVKSGGNFAGGIIGADDGEVQHTMTNCKNYGNVTAGRFAGGIIGKTVRSVYFTSCYNGAKIETTNDGKDDSCTGGIIGINENANELKFTNCVNDGIIYNIRDSGGGMIGLLRAYKDGTYFISCVNNGTINKKTENSTTTTTGTYYNAGLIGKSDNDNGVIIQDCTNTADVFVKSTDMQYVAGIAGYIKGPLTMSGTKNTGNISAGQYTAGLIAWIEDDGCTITDCRNEGNVSSNGYNNAAGILSTISSQTNSATWTIKNTVNTGNVSGASAVGGFIGYMANTSTGRPILIQDSYNYGNITSSGTEVGGFVGNMDNHGSSSLVHTYTRCYNYGDISTTSTGDTYAGGIVGKEMGFCKFTECSNTGKVTSASTSNNSFSGGIVGWIQDDTSSFNSCYNKGYVSGRFAAGGIVGYIGSNSNTFTMNTCYNLGTICGYSNYGHIGGLVGMFYGGTLNMEKCFNGDGQNGQIGLTNNMVHVGGGLIGFTDKTIKITACYSHSPAILATSTNNDDYAGGLIGHSSGTTTIYNSYAATNTMTGKNRGSIVGYGSPTTNCTYYSTIYNSYTKTNGTSKSDADFKATDIISLLGTSYYTQDKTGVNGYYPIFGTYTGKIKVDVHYDNQFDFDSYDFRGVTVGNSPIIKNNEENSITFTSQSADDYTNGQNFNQSGTSQISRTPAQLNCMTLIPGHTYRISYSYTTNKAASVNFYVFSNSTNSSYDWGSGKMGNDGSGYYYKITSSITAAGSSSASATFKVPSGRKYVTIRCGTTTNGVTVTFKDIYVQDITNINGAVDNVSTPDPKLKTVDYNGSVSSFPSITRSGYTFRGWSTTQDSTTGNGNPSNIVTSLSSITENKHLYSCWSPAVIFDPNDGSSQPNLLAATHSANNKTDPITTTTDNGVTITFNRETSEFTLDGTATTPGQSINVLTSMLPDSFPAGTYTLNLRYTSGSVTGTGTNFSTSPSGGKNSYIAMCLETADDNGNGLASPYRFNLETYGSSQSSSCTGTISSAQLSKAKELIYHIIPCCPTGTSITGLTFNNYKFKLELCNSGSVNDVAAPNPLVQNYGSALGTLPTPTRTGYTFAGWYTAASGGTQITSSTTMGKSSMTAYAHWTPIKYNITYKNGYDGTTVATQSYTIVDSVTLNGAPTRTGYTFAGWKLETAVNTWAAKTYSASENVGTGKYGDITLVAQWTAKTYNLKFDFNGGNVNGNSSVTVYPTFGSGNYNSLDSWGTPSRTGYTFAGMFTAATGGTQVYYNNGKCIPGTAYWDSSSCWCYDGDVTLYAHWTANTYTVTFDKQSGTGGTDSVSVTFDSAMPTITVPTRTGYTFDGYFTEKNGGGTQYYKADGTSARTWNIAANTTLYAHWTATEYTITYVYNNGSNNTTDKYTIEKSITLPSPTKTGYTFAGWKVTTAGGNWYTTDSAYSGTVAKGKYGNVTLTAQWTATEYTITYVYNNGSNNTTDKYTIEKSITLPSPTKTGYTFAGWKVTTAGGNWYTTDSAYSGTVAKGKYGNVTLTAQWTATEYTITYVYNNGSNNTTDKYTIEKSITLPSPTKTGYTFAGWKVTTAGGNWYTTDSTYSGTVAKGKYGNVTLTAQWTATEYTITYVYNNGSNNTTDKYTIEKSITLPSPTKTGYTFAGWKVTTAGGNWYTTDSTYSGTVAKGKYGNVTLTAQWTANTYIVRFHSNYDADTTKDQTITFDVDTALEANSFTRTGHTFGYWTTSSDGTGTKYADEATVKNLTSVKNGVVNLYVVWIKSEEAQEDSKTYKDIKVTYGYNKVNNEAYELSLDDVKIKEYAPEQYNAYDTYKKAIVTYNEKKNAYDSKNLTKAEDYYNAVNALIDATEKLENLKVVSLLDKMTLSYNIDGETKTLTKTSVKDINLNYYTTETLDKIKEYFKTAFANTGLKLNEQNTFNGYVKNVAEQCANISAVESSVTYDVHETAKAVNAQLSNSNNDIKAVNYVYTGKGNYTYYCYTNSVEPHIVINALEGSKINTTVTGNRVTYPTRMTASSTEQANSISCTNKTESNVYAKYTNNDDYSIGNNYTGDVNGVSLTGADYYSTYTQIELHPSFTTDKQTVSYTISAKDDALVKDETGLVSNSNYAKTANLAGTAKTTDISENNITIIISYHNSKGTFCATPAQVDADKALNQYHLFRTSAGASNWELPKSGDSIYTVDHGDYGQCGLGSFTYTFTTTDSTEYSFDFDNCTAAVPKGSTPNNVDKTALLEAIIKELKTVDENGKYKNLNEMSSKKFSKAEYETVDNKSEAKSGTGVGYSEWGNNWSYNYYPQTGAFTYVHLIDRWGNTFDGVFCVGTMDYIYAQTTSSSAGVYEILEAGGSGIDSLSLNAASMEILTDENSTLENNVYKTTGNTIKIKTGEANKSYTLTMKDKATNASTAALTSDENGIITLNVTDEEYTSGVYTFTLNGIEINLYDSVNNDKYIVSVTNGETEEGEYAELSVITTGEVGKIRFTDTDGNAVTIASCNKNADGTKTWAMSKKRSVGEYEYGISVKVGNDWIEESSKGKLTFTAKVLDSGLIRSAEYDAESGLYKITIEGRATKIQFITEDGMTRTYTRYNESVKSVKTYDAEENKVNDTARTLDHEVWLVNAKLYSGLKYTVAAKFEAGWNMDGTTTLTAR